MSAEIGGGDGRPILAARRSGSRRRDAGKKRHGPPESEDGSAAAVVVRFSGRILPLAVAAQPTVESPRTKSAVAGERGGSAAAPAPPAKQSRTRRRSAMRAALWREQVAGVRGEVEMESCCQLTGGSQ